MRLDSNLDSKGEKKFIEDFGGEH